MSLSNLLLSQLADPFRIGLLLALFVTMLRTRAASGTIVPRAAGAVLVAGILPVSAQSTLAAPLATLVGVGIVANAALLAIMLGAWTLYQRSKT